MADFVLQTEWQAINKWNNNLALISHTTNYSTCWLPLIVIIQCIHTHPNLVWFLPITFVSHTITDYFTSKLNHKLWEKKKVYSFFVSIGFDQFLHIVQLVLTYYFLTI
jgi:hypothetical protein